MASIQSNINSAFNALLVAGLGASRAIGQSEFVQSRKREAAIVKEGKKGADLINQLVPDGDLTQVENITTLSEAVQGQVGKAKELVTNRPTSENVATYHRISGAATQLQPAIDQEAMRRAALSTAEAAQEAQKRELNRRLGAATTLEEREKILTELGGAE